MAMINVNVKTNYVLAEAVVKAGNWFQYSVEDIEFVPLSKGGFWGEVLAQRRDWLNLEVVPNEAEHIDGHYNKWAFRNDIEPFEYERARAGVVSVYAISYGGGGPEEGGWSWDRFDLVAVFEATDSDEWALSHAQSTAQSWVDARPDDERYAVYAERQVGYHQTVGGQHYA